MIDTTPFRNRICTVKAPHLDPHLGTRPTMAAVLDTDAPGLAERLGLTTSDLAYSDHGQPCIVLGLAAVDSYGKLTARPTYAAQEAAFLTKRLRDRQEGEQRQWAGYLGDQAEKERRGRALMEQTHRLQAEQQEQERRRDPHYRLDQIEQRLARLEQLAALEAKTSTTEEAHA